MAANDDLSKSTTIVTSDDCLSTTMDGESVILHVEQGKYYGFNEVGTEVWEFVQEPHTVGEICRTLQNTYDVEEERCLDDVRELVTKLLEFDLVRSVDE